MSTDEQGYNGWKNYPTWNVNLWLSNDEGLYHEALERTHAIVRGVESGRMGTVTFGEVGTSVDVPARVYVADAIKAWVRDELEPDLGASFAADLLGFALDQVDWFELADAWLEQVEEHATA